MPSSGAREKFPEAVVYDQTLDMNIFEMALLPPSHFPINLPRRIEPCSDDIKAGGKYLAP
jgi:hypothetical protein